MKKVIVSVYRTVFYDGEVEVTEEEYNDLCDPELCMEERNEIIREVVEHELFDSDWDKEPIEVDDVHVIKEAS